MIIQMNYQELGTFIKGKRKEQKLSRRQLAEVAEISQGTIQNIEEGLRIREDYRNKILNALGYSAKEVYLVKTNN